MSMTIADKVLRFGIVGLGKAASMTLPHLAKTQGIALAAAADPREDARRAFSESTGLAAFETIEELVKSAEIEAVWIATPNECHADHAVIAASAGKHVVCEKPMALTLMDCDRMIEAATANRVKLMLGNSKLRQAPITKIREIVESSMLGNVIHITTMNFNDWLQRPRLAAEVDTDRGGGICYRQAPHQVDIVRYLACSPAHSIRAVAARADANFPTEGNYTALLDFDGGIAASLVYNAYGYFDISEMTWDIGEGGDVVSRKGGAERLTGPVTTLARYAPAGQGTQSARAKRHQPFYGLTIVACERGILRQSPDGLYIYDQNGRHEVFCDDEAPVSLDLHELLASIREAREPFPNGKWGKATLEVCLGLLQSSIRREEIALGCQKY